MTAVNRGLGPDSIKARCSNEEGVGMDIVLVCIDCRCSVAIPPLFFKVGVSNECSLVERVVFQGFLPGEFEV